MTFCLLVCQMCGKGTFSQIRSHMLYNTYVTGFAKRGLPHTSNLPTLTIDNFILERAIALKFGQW